jgi:hypothetical protein
MVLRNDMTEDEMTVSRKSTRIHAKGVRRIGQIEQLERRDLFATIVWDQELNFDFLGENEPLARQLTQRAIDDWSKVIVDFNYDGDNNPQTDNTLVVNIGIFPFLGSTRGMAAVAEGDANGLPRKAEIFLDAEGGEQGWYFDPTSGDDAEFLGGLVDPFHAESASLSTNDFYRTILHELGHAMGIKAGSDLAFDRFLMPAGTDQIDPSGQLKVFHNPNGLFGSQGFSATITTSGGVHVYEGPADPAFPDASVHSGDLRTPDARQRRHQRCDH